MKISLRHFVLPAALLALAGGAALAQGPVFDYRRTLHASLGQHSLVLEAPAGMCFLDEADYLQGLIAAHLKNTGLRGAQSKLIASFADCMQIAKVEKQYRDLLAKVEAEPPVTDEDPPSIEDHGSVYWVNPGTGAEQVAMPLDAYLDVRERSFRDEIIARLSYSYETFGAGAATSDGLLSAVTHFEPPEKYNFGPATHRTPEGLSLAYTLESEVEYRKVHTAGAFGTTLIDSLPIEVAVEYNGRSPDKSAEELYAVMDSFLAQQVILNEDQ